MTTEELNKVLEFVVDAMTAEDIKADVRGRVVNRVIFGDPMKPEPMRHAGMRLEWEPQPHPKPIVNPYEAAYLRAVGLPDELFDVSPPAERNGHDPDTPVWP